MIMDSLTHLTRNGGWFGTDLDASLSALLQSMDDGGVDRALLAGIPGADDDDLLLDAVRAHPGRFVPVAGVDVARHEHSQWRGIEARLERIREQGFAGIKLHPRLSGVALTDPRIREAVRLAGKLDLAVLVCTIHRPPLPPLGRPVSDALYELCGGCENTRMVLVHGGYTDALATSELVRPMEHVLLDLSLTLTRFAGASVGRDCAWLLEHFDRRVCLGSDFPESGMADVRRAVRGLGLDPDADELRGAFGENLERFLHG